LDHVLEDSDSVDGVFLDLGVSSMQLDESIRGFSYAVDGPLDMRMGPDGLTAKDLIENSDADELALILRRYGEVRRAKVIARKIKEASEKGGMTTTADLKSSVERVLGAGASPSALSRVFQAIRIRVNSELENLDSFLKNVPGVVNCSGRIVIISYHSLEDRAVKSFFRQESSGCLCPPETPVCVCGQEPKLRVLTRRVVKSSAGEIAGNPRSRSARLRAAEIIA
jgi:16S rRNA (cytosine1402-N4)-methyltransferase